MMLGHALVAFAVVALVAHRGGWEPRRATALGAVAAAFATIPDVDMVYALTGVTGGTVDPVRATVALAAGDVETAFEVANAFWGTSTVTHRTMTHSLVVAVPAAAAFAVGTARSRRGPASALAAATLVGVVAVAFLASGSLGGLVMTTFVVAGVLVAAAARRYTDFEARHVFVAALFGLVSHPFGDVVTGEPPALLYPLDAEVLDGRVPLHDDATLHLLGAFAIELGVVWLALVAVATLWDLRLREAVHPAAGLGVAYAGVVLWLPPPTLTVSYHFVFSILGVGTTLGAPAWRRSDGQGWLPVDRRKAWGFAVTSTAAVTLALTAYVAGYLLI